LGTSIGGAQPRLLYILPLVTALERLHVSSLVQNGSVAL
jgi:hypothetical protein